MHANLSLAIIFLIVIHYPSVGFLGTSLMLVLELFRLSNQYLAVVTCIVMIPSMAQAKLFTFTIWCIAMCFIEFVVVVYFKIFLFAIFAGVRLRTLIPVRQLGCGFLPFLLQRIFAEAQQTALWNTIVAILAFLGGI